MARDVLIINGTVVDGSGAAGVRADVLVRDGRIAEVGALAADKVADTLPGLEVINAADRIVCPGFIDMHAHSDVAAALDGALAPKLRQGITTVVTGNCGASAAPLNALSRPIVRRMSKGLYGVDCPMKWSGMGQYLDTLREQGTAANIYPLAGFGNLRIMALGLWPGPAGPLAVRAMRRELRRAMDQGARGFSTGLIYPPQNFARPREVDQVLSALRGRDAFYSTHMRNEADDLEPALDEALSAARKAGVRLQVSHHKAEFRRNWGKVERTMEMIESARDAGLDVAADVYPYTACATNLMVMAFGRPIDDPSDIMLLELRKRPELTGKRLTEAMEQFGLGARAAVLRLAAEEGGLSLMAAAFFMCEDDVQFLLKHPLVTIGSDGMDGADIAGVMTHPRLCGSHVRVLKHYSLDEKLLPLEEAIRKMTSAPAARLGLSRRGLIKERYAADIVVFDPARLQDNATWLEPVRFPDGMDAVLVNGRIAVRNDTQTPARAGEIL